MSIPKASFSTIRNNFSDGKIPGNVFLVCSDQILSGELIDAVFTGFVGADGSKSDSLATFTADDLKVDSLMNECMGGGLFSSRKVVVIRNPKKLTKAKRTAVTEYLADPNPDVCMFIVSEEDDSPEKTVIESKDNDAKAGRAKKNLTKVVVSEMSDAEMITWIREKFGDFEIGEDSATHILSVSNNNLAEIFPEIEKLKTFCHFKRSVTVEDINMCNGITRDFSESDFLKAVFNRDTGSAYRIYSSISLKKEMEVYLVFLLAAAYSAVRKLGDPASSKLQGFSLQRELKLWGPVQTAMLPLYQKASSELSDEAVGTAISMVREADKKFKSSSGEKSVIMSNLIRTLCSL